ncbi:alpha/beta fold hydrolase [Corallincola platygyrae]|uniref:Alpha/beta fold hydrolase n=1 Tax=Corallincola platygyrae TaxID=1193278 RepID=A0ABW4XT94_9GAMM
MMHEHLLDVEGRSIAALSTHKALPSQPILCFHGWLDNAASFIPLMQAAPELPWLAIDWPGHGHSYHKQEQYHFVDYVDEVYALYQLFGNQPLNLVGHSLGGLAAAMFAGSFPDKVKHLVSIEAVGPMAWAPETAPEILRKAILSRRRQPRAVSSYQTEQEAIEARVAAQPCLPEAAAKLLVTRNLEQKDSGWHWRSDPKLRTLSPLRVTPAQAEAWVRAVSAPTLVVEGVSGYEMVKQAISERRSWFQTLTLERIGGGHHPHMESADRLATLVRAFLNPDPDTNNCGLEQIL